jgi:hypothetical protein
MKDITVKVISVFPVNNSSAAVTLQCLLDVKDDIRATQWQHVSNESTSHQDKFCLDSTTSMTGSRTPHTTMSIQHSAAIHLFVVYLTTLKLCIVCDRHTWTEYVKHWWNDSDNEKLKYSERTHPSGTLSASNSTRTDLRSSPVFLDDRSATNRLSQGTISNEKIIT